MELGGGMFPVAFFIRFKEEKKPPQQQNTKKQNMISISLPICIVESAYLYYIYTSIEVLFA